MTRRVPLGWVWWSRSRVPGSCYTQRKRDVVIRVEQVTTSQRSRIKSPRLTLLIFPREKASNRGEFASPGGKSVPVPLVGRGENEGCTGSTGNGGTAKRNTLSQCRSGRQGASAKRLNRDGVGFGRGGADTTGDDHRLEETVRVLNKGQQKTFLLKL